MLISNLGRKHPRVWIHDFLGENVFDHSFGEHKIRPAA